MIVHKKKKMDYNIVILINGLKMIIHCLGANVPTQDLTNCQTAKLYRLHITHMRGTRLTKTKCEHI